MTTLIDTLLEEQQQLTAVERFARRHPAGGEPAQARYYRSLIPLARPQPGEQFAFAVDLDLCTSCKGCVSACHSLNGLDEDEIWRNVGLIHGGTTEAPYQQTITTACHHCVEPACLQGCPVMAYEKDEATGIVRHLDDQCIGCQYCVLKCPYDVPKYSSRRGIVRKCDMCYQRLAVNEAPACVQACPSEAITIRLVSQETTRALTEPGDRLVPGAFDSAYTLPTTTYFSRKEIPANARAADSHRLRHEHAHWPLVGMLVLTQWAAGLFACGVFFPPVKLLAFGLLNAGLAVSVLHLGRPMGAWRFFLGLRTSWMSREILAFSLFAAAAGAFTFLPIFAVPLGVLTTLLGALGIWCSAMIYIDTRRPFWAAPLTLPKFFGTAVVLGLATLSAFAPSVSGVALVGLLALTAWEVSVSIAAARDASSAWHRSALLQAPLLPFRFALFAAAVGSGLVALSSASQVAAAGFALLTAAGAIVERYCFFTAVQAPRMPGGVAS